jgi:uncharacterized membrane protein
LELSSTTILLLSVGVGIVYLIVLFVSIFDVLTQGGITLADRLLWVFLVTFVPVLGFIVYWSMAHRLARDDPTTNTARRVRNDRAERGDARDEDGDGD